MIHFVYRHIRLDKNEPFYIGIGTKKDRGFKSTENEFHRAYSMFRKDSKIWNSIVSKTDYDVEILFESEDYNFIKEKEIEFIKLYGRIDLGTGILANMTDGGDGTLGWIPSEENLKNLRLSKLNRDYSNFGNKVYQYSLEGKFIKEWRNITEASEFTGTHKSYLAKLLKDNLNGNFCKGYYWYSERKNEVEIKPFNDRSFYKRKEANRAC